MNCTQAGCNSAATYKIYWPGSSPVLACENHKQLATEIANSLQIKLVVEKMLYDPDTDEKKR